MVKAEYEARFNNINTVLLVPNTPDVLACGLRGASEEIRILTLAVQFAPWQSSQH